MPVLGYMELKGFPGPKGQHIFSADAHLHNVSIVKPHCLLAMSTEELAMVSPEQPVRFWLKHMHLKL